MITIIYSTHKDIEYNKKFREHLEKTVGIDNVQILEYVNKNEFSLAQIYNRGISESKHDIVVCCHNDIKLENKWGKKLLNDFEKNPDFAIIGKAGSCYFPESGIYWERMNQTMVGQVYHHPSGKNKWINKYSGKLPFLIPVVTIDGLFISFDKTKIKHTFDETIGKFHYYDHCFALSNYLEGIKIGVTTSFEITHESVGQPNSEFYESRQLFLEKYSSVLPLDLKPKEIFYEKSEVKPLKNFKKVAVVIPTKSKLDLLFGCLTSFMENCDKNQYKVFVADTGSSDEEKNEINNFIEQNKENISIELIEYDYYNFGKINNDVVSKHVNDEFDFLLFCNNDIKLLNNVIYEMLSVYKTSSNVGTVGARLHFDDNTIQHCGMVLFIDTKKAIQISHLSLRAYYKYNQSVDNVIGNTGALLMIRRNTFIKCGMFNENYLDCFEDVELNLKCILLGQENYISNKAVAYHYESQTRNDDETKIAKLTKDFKERLFPFIINNFEKFKNKILVQQ